MVEIVTYRPEHSHAFKTLNYAWIEQLFEVEGSDKEILENPEREILNKGGHILMALLDGEPIGTCSLIKKDETCYELAKMAVSEEVRGKKIGWELGNAIVNKAKELGAEKIILETNSALKPAIGLYGKLGFQDSSGEDSQYQRCNIKMEMEL